MSPGAGGGGEAADPLRQALAARRAAGEATLRQRFARAIADGARPTDADPADLARYLATVSHGLAVQAAGGASHEALPRVVEMALRAWPA